MTSSLFSSIKLGEIELAHRIVLAPMTRIRANQTTLAATELMANYYAQRTSPGGLLITEATHISAEATPVWSIYPQVKKYGGHVPGIWTNEQTLAWKKVTDAVHRRGGKIICQLLHAGRVAQPVIGEHPLVKNSDWPLPPVSASAVAFPACSDVENQYSWDQASVTPRALLTKEIPRVIHDYQCAAANALKAGFDGIEIHAAHGYLVDQFICDGVNQRTDKYGGSIDNRCRFLFEIVKAVVEVFGTQRVGVRLSPLLIDKKSGLQTQTYFAVSCSDPVSVYSHAVNGLNNYPLAYLMLTEPRVGGLSQPPINETAYLCPLRNRHYREIYKGRLIGAGGFTPATAARAVSQGAYDLIAFGRWFLSNPDLPSRIKHGQKLNVYQRQTFYGGNEIGYTDYPYWNCVMEDGKSRYKLMEQSDLGPKFNN